MLSLLREGDHVVASQFLFGNTVSQFNTLVAHGTDISFVDATDVANVERALTPATRLIFVETIANPRTQVADLARIGALARERGILYVVDNTMTSPALFRPKAVGAGLVVNALTKYIGGHGNALAGSITDTGLFDWTRFPNIADNYKSQPPAMWGIQQIRKKGLRDWGGTLAAGEAHSISVGAETLVLRMERTCANAQALAGFLAAHPKVRTVYYPGLPSHPQHALARSLFGGFGGLFAFELADGIDCFDFLNRLEIVVSSSNLGDNRTLAIPVAHTIFWEMGAERRAAMGIAEALIRVSVGIEDCDGSDRRFRAGARGNVGNARYRSQERNPASTPDLHRARSPAVRVEFEIAATVVPVGKHVALAVATVDDQTMVRGTMRVTVDDPRNVRRRETPLRRRAVRRRGWLPDLARSRRGSCDAARSRCRVAMRRAARESTSAGADRA